LAQSGGTSARKKLNFNKRRTKVELSKPSYLNVKGISSFDRQETNSGLVKESAEHDLSSNIHFSKQLTKTTDMIEFGSDQNATLTKSLQQGPVKGSVEYAISVNDQLAKQSAKRIGLIKSTSERQDQRKNLRSKFAQQISDRNFYLAPVGEKEGQNKPHDISSSSQTQNLTSVKEEEGQTKPHDISGSPQTQQLSRDSPSTVNLKIPNTIQQVSKPKNDREGFLQLIRKKSQEGLNFIRRISTEIVLDSERKIDPTDLKFFSQSTPLHNVCKLDSKYASCDPSDIFYKIRHYVLVCKRLTKIKDGNGSTPLHLACATGLEVRTIKYLMETNPEVCLVSDNEGCLPLHKACQRQDIDSGVIRLLHARFPDTASIKDNFGNTPFEYNRLASNLIE